ncbi:hypothetical protein D3C73_1652090 [compost metagenome]
MGGFGAADEPALKADTQSRRVMGHDMINRSSSGELAQSGRARLRYDSIDW